MAKLAAGWGEGVKLLEQLPAKGREARLELAIARTCHTHFESVANQVEFYLLRGSVPIWCWKATTSVLMGKEGD
jgi:hypothetical protein